MEPRPPRVGAHIASLDGLRGIAILLVLLHHFGPRFTAPGPLEKVLSRAAGLGWTGVDLFFVLSGFLITRILLQTRDDPGYFRTFYVRRSLRIFPLYYVAILLLVGLVPLAVHLDAATVGMLHGRWPWLVVYAQNIAATVHGDWYYSTPALNLDHFWSLAVEEQFYLVWPAAVWFLSRKTLARVAAGIVLGAPLLRGALVAAGAPEIAPFILTPCRVDSMMIGALITMAYDHAAWRDRIHVWAPRALLGATLLFPLLIVPTGDYGPTAAPMATLGYTVLAVGAGGLLVMTVAAAPTSRVGRLMTSRPLVFFGRYSYGLYVVHMPLRGGLSALLHPETWAARLGSQVLAWAAWLCVATAASVAIALLSWHLVEARFLALKKYFEYSAPRAPAEDGSRRELPAAQA